MNRTLLVCILSVSLAPLWGQISSFPYYQNFETFSLCVPDCQGGCTLSANWDNPSGDRGDWTVHSGPTGTSATGPSFDFDPGMGNGKYVYVEAFDVCIGKKNVFLETPEFNFQNNSLPVLEFYYHLFGSGQGSLHVDADTNGVRILDVIPPIYGNEDRWKRMSVCMGDFAGLSRVTFRFRAVTSFSETSDMALDAVKVYQGHARDVFANEILTTGCGLGPNHDITFTFGNLGTQTINDVTATYSINNGAFIPVEVVPGSFTSCDLPAYTFNRKANFSGPGPHKITVVVGLAGHSDPDQQNDTMISFVRDIPVVDKFPYEEDFENNAGAWHPAGERISWAWGTPNASWISAAGEGTHAWVTNLSGAYQQREFSFLESDCFDFSAMTVDPILTFLHTYQLEEGQDLCWVEFSTNGGRAWQKMGTDQTGIDNWYNSFFRQAWTDISAVGAGNWQVASHELTGLAGKRVRLRFVMLSDGSVHDEGVGIDHIRILNPRDLEVVKILSPVTNCEGLLTHSETVRARVLNKGFYNVSGYAMGLKVDNQTFPSEPVSGVLLSGDSIDYTFVSKGDFSAMGPHFITVAAAYSSDSNPADNQLVKPAGNFLEPSFSLGADTVLCGGDTLSLDPAITNGSYKWSTGATTQKLNVTSSGFYTLELTDQNGCLGRDSINVVIPPPLGILVDSLLRIKCYGDSTGKIQIRVQGGIPPYSLRWARGDTIRILENLPAGYYPYTIVDGIGCGKTDSIEVLQNDSISIEIDAVVDAGCPADSTGAIFITPRGGQRPYNFFWSNFSKNEDLPRIPEGNYQVNITDVNGCTYRSPVYEVVTNDTLPKADFAFHISGERVFFTDFSLNAVQYTWRFGDGSSSTSDPNPQHVYKANDTFTVVLIATNSCGADTIVRSVLMMSVGLDDDKFPATITMYPNPASGNRFYLDIKEANLNGTSVTLYQLNGQEIFHQDLGSVRGNHRIMMEIKPEWAEGLYLVGIRSEEGKIFRKLVIRKK